MQAARAGGGGSRGGRRAQHAAHPAHTPAVRGLQVLLGHAAVGGRRDAQHPARLALAHAQRLVRQLGAPGVQQRLRRQAGQRVRSAWLGRVARRGRPEGLPCPPLLYSRPGIVRPAAAAPTPIPTPALPLRPPHPSQPPAAAPHGLPAATRHGQDRTGGADSTGGTTARPAPRRAAGQAAASGVRGRLAAPARPPRHPPAAVKAAAQAAPTSISG